MVFGKSGSNDGKNRVQIDSIEDLKLHKIKASELGNIYVDKNGQEYKLRYDPIKKKVIIIKIIKSILNGKFVRDKFDDIAKDNKIKSEVKQKMGELGKEYIKDHYQINDSIPSMTSSSSESTTPPPPSDPPVEETQSKSFDGITIKSVDDVVNITGKIIERLEMALKNILESNILDERYSYDDKIVLDDLRMLIKNDIIGEFQNLRENYDDIYKGFNDDKLKNKLYGDDIKAILAVTPQSERINVLRELEAIELYKKGLKNILKTFDDMDYKISIIPQDKINAKTFHDRQKFSDARYSFNTCKEDTSKLLSYFNTLYEEKLKS